MTDEVISITAVDDVVYIVESVEEIETVESAIVLIVENRLVRSEW